MGAERILDTVYSRVWVPFGDGEGQGKSWEKPETLPKERAGCKRRFVPSTTDRI